MKRAIIVALMVLFCCSVLFAGVADLRVTRHTFVPESQGEFAKLILEVENGGNSGLVGVSVKVIYYFRDNLVDIKLVRIGDVPAKTKRVGFTYLIDGRPKHDRVKYQFSGYEK